MATLRDKLISSTFPSLLHTENELELPATGLRQFQDGVGNDSALLLGRSGQGAVIVGGLSAVGTAPNRFLGDTFINGTVLTLSATSQNRITGNSNAIVGATTVNGSTTFNGPAVTINGQALGINATNTIISGNKVTINSTLETNGLAVGDLTYPSSAGTPTTDPLFVQLNSARTGLVLSRINPDELTSTNNFVVTRTVYVNSGSQNGFLFRFQLFGGGTGQSFSDKATTIALPDSYEGAKGGIFFLTMEQDLDNANITIVASPDRAVNSGGTLVIPDSSNRYVVVGGSGDSSDDDNFRCAGQFQCRINGADPVLTFTNIGATRLSPEGAGITCAVYAIARQY